MPELWKQFGLQLIAPGKNVKSQLEPGLRFWDCGGFVSTCLNNIEQKTWGIAAVFLASDTMKIIKTLGSKELTLQ